MKKNIFPMVFLATGLLLSATEVLFKASFTDGGIVTEPAGLTVKTFGKPEYLEGALVLDGNGSCIQIDNPVTLNCKAAQSFTLEFSYFPEETGKKEGTYIKLFSRGSLPAHYWNLSAHLRCGTPAVKAGHRPDGKYKGLYNNLSMITPSTGKWHRIGIVRNAKLKRISFYHNGIAVHEFDDELPELFDNQDAALYIGGMPDEGTFKGKIGTIIMREGVHPVNAVTPEEIKPLPEKEVAIDPEVKKSWDILKDNALHLVPAPKRIKLAGAAFDFIPADWKVTRHSLNDAAGLEEFNRRLAQTGLPKLNQHGEKHEIIAGLCDDLKIYAPDGNKPQRQGYLIRFSGTPDARKIVLAGTDDDGLRYAWLTLTNLLKDNATITPVEIEDWPDFEKRFAWSIFSAGKEAYQIVDEAFRAKTNFIALGGGYNKKNWLSHNRDTMRKLTDYAKARGIDVLVGSMTILKDFPADTKIPEGFNDLYYPWTSENGLFGYKKGGCSWSREDLMHSRSAEYATIMQDYGFTALNLHSTDHGGLDNPSNWNLRSPECRKRWKDSEHAEADANMVMIFYEELKKKNPDLWLYFTQYPYVITRDEKTLEYYSKLSSLLKSRSNDTISISLRESTRSEIEYTLRHFASENIVFAYYPFGMFCYPFTTLTGRYAATFHFGAKSKVQFYLGTPFGFFRYPSRWTSAEYMWNAYAPGAAYLPANKYDYNVIFGSSEIIENELIPRITALLYGEKAAKKLAWCFTLKMSDEIPGYPNGILPADLDRQKYFSWMAEVSRKGTAIVKEVYPDILPEAKEASNGLADFFLRSELLAEARLCVIRSRKLLDKGKTEQATIEAAKGIAILQNPETHWRNRHKNILADLNIESEISLRVKLGEYLKNVSEKPLQVAFYAYSGTGKVQDSIGTLPLVFNGVKGLKISTISNLSKAELAKIDVLVFNATSDLGDCSENAIENISDFVRKDGKGIIFTHNALGRNKGVFSNSLFPEVFKGFGGVSPEAELKINDATFFGEDFKNDVPYIHRYYDHTWGFPGPEGKVIIKDSLGNAVTIFGEAGKGRAIFTGEIFGRDRADRLTGPEFDEWKMFFNLVRKAGGK